MIASVGRLAVAGELHRARDQRVRPSGRQPDHQRLLVDPAEPSERLLRRAGHDLGAQVEQHQQVAQVAGEERHLVGAGDQHLLGGDDRVDRRLDVRARELVRGVLDVDVVGGERRLELGVVQREQRCGGGNSVVGAVAAAAVLVARGLLQLGEALEAERLREAHDGARGGVGAAGQLLGGLERRLVEVVDDVLGDVLLGTRELVEARPDVGGQGLVAVGCLGGGGRAGCLLHGQASDSTPACGVPSARAPSLHHFLIGRRESEPFVEAVGVPGCKSPPKLGVRSVVDRLAYQLGPKPTPAVLG